MKTQIVSAMVVAGLLAACTGATLDAETTANGQSAVASEETTATLPEKAVTLYGTLDCEKVRNDGVTTAVGTVIGKMVAAMTNALADQCDEANTLSHNRGFGYCGPRMCSHSYTVTQEPAKLEITGNSEFGTNRENEGTTVTTDKDGATSSRTRTDQTTSTRNFKVTAGIKLTVPLGANTQLQCYNPMEQEGVQNFSSSLGKDEKFRTDAFKTIARACGVPLPAEAAAPSTGAR